MCPWPESKKTGTVAQANTTANNGIMMSQVISVQAVSGYFACLLDPE